MATSIRQATCRDAEAIVEFQLRMALETEGLSLDPSTVAAGVRAVLDEPRRGRYYVAEVDGELAGELLTTSEWSDWRNGTVLWLQSVYVRPRFRGQGVMRALYEHLRGLVRADGGLKGLRLYVARDNATARKAYQAMGMDGLHYRMYEWMK